MSRYLRSTLDDQINAEIKEFLCRLVDMLELEDRLPNPAVIKHRKEVELIWTYNENTLRIYVSKPHNYRFVCDTTKERLFEGTTKNGKQLIQVLRNLVAWLLDEYEDVDHGY